MIDKGNRKKIGITLDAYKLPKYRQALEKFGYQINVDFEESQILRDGTMLIGLFVEEREFKDAVELIKSMCTRLELAFKQRREV